MHSQKPAREMHGLMQSHATDFSVTSETGMGQYVAQGSNAVDDAIRY